MMRTIRSAIGVTLLAALYGCQTPPPPPPSPSGQTPVAPTTLPQRADDFTEESFRNLRFIDADDLDPNFRATDEPLAKALERLSTSVRAYDFKLDPSLAAAGVRPDLPVTVAVERATTRTALDALLAAASAKTPGHPALAYTTAGPNQLLITTRADLYANHLFTREILAIGLMPDWSNPERLADLARLIKETVDPTSWDVPGNRCALRVSKDKLTVTQTPENLDLIEKLMEDLNATNSYGDLLERRMNRGGRWVPK